MPNMDVRTATGRTARECRNQTDDETLEVNDRQRLGNVTGKHLPELRRKYLRRSPAQTKRTLRGLRTLPFRQTRQPPSAFGANDLLSLVRGALGRFGVH